MEEHNLPKSDEILTLTLDEMKNASISYLEGALNRTCGEDQEELDAIQFVRSAVNVMTFAASNYKTESNGYRTVIDLLLKHLPHCRVNVEKDCKVIMGNSAFLDWCEFTNIEYDLIHLDYDCIYVFRSEEDRILFKLRWL